MGRKKHKAKNFVMLSYVLLNDPNWQKLSGSAKILWIYLRKKFNHKTLSRVTLSYGEMKNIMTPKTMSRALKELIDKGWIKKVKEGGLYGGLSEYIFTGEHKDFYYLKQRFKV